jgi:hypothetical protein
VKADQRDAARALRRALDAANRAVLVYEAAP